MKACLALIPADNSAAELEPVLAQAKACNCDRTYITSTGASKDIAQYASINFYPWFSSIA
jgi:hypothetical protein